MKLSIIIPTLNEAARIQHTLQSLQTLRGTYAEIILVDGGSNDNTLMLAQSLCDYTISSARGRAQQMNAGAAIATGDVLLFLHADTQLPTNALAILQQHEQSLSWGRFDIRLSGQHFLFRIIERMINSRSRLTGIATGDQAIFVTRELFFRSGAYPALPLMEDIALSRTLRQHNKPLCLRDTVISDSRYWETHGIIRTVCRMWYLRLAYFCGVSSEKLVRQYYRNT
ncbi:MAG: TIGR04283 family arsenosugar biosynthesis glycosyltransferase [Gammaproteobacteria bacterium]|nr:TIGR04283 family arsenosugar biosynthesis glycosyltransferase [Gammaproteobacteria bacterium]